MFSSIDCNLVHRSALRGKKMDVRVVLDGIITKHDIVKVIFEDDGSDLEPIISGSR
jgi:hypothetical protein